MNTEDMHKTIADKVLDVVPVELQGDSVVLTRVCVSDADFDPAGFERKILGITKMVEALKSAKGRVIKNVSYDNSFHKELNPFQCIGSFILELEPVPND